MIQILLMLILLVLTGVFSITAIVYLIIAIVKWKKQKSYKLSLGLFAVFGLCTLLIFNIDLTSAEATNRKDSVPAFESNFGFNPPSTVKEIKHKNFSLYGASVHWMSFTYDSIVFDKIILHDQPLLIANANTNRHSEIIREFENKNPNAPDWFEAPISRTEKIYYKKDFLNHNFSEYYLWRSGDMIHMTVHYFD